MYVPPKDVVRDAASLKQFTVTIRQHDPITIYARDEAEALDAITRCTSQFNDSHNAKPHITDASFERMDGEPVVDLAAIEPLQQQIGDLERQLREEEERHAAAMQDINDRLAATRAAISTVRQAKERSSLERRLEAARPGITSELNDVRSRLRQVQRSLLLELWNGASDDKALADARERVALAEKQCQQLRSFLNQALHNSRKEAELRSLQRELYRNLRPALAKLEAENSTRKPLAWHREQEAALVAKYNELVTEAVNAITDKPTGPPEVVVVPQQKQCVPQYQSVYRGMRPAVSDAVRC